MKNIFTILFIILSIYVLEAQTTMNIYQNNGTEINLPVATIDSQTFILNPPPATLNIYQVGGGIVIVPLNNIDSITYTVAPNTNGFPVLSTQNVTNISENNATSGGFIVENGGSPITQRGVVWSTSQNPTVANNLTTDGTGTGNFSSSLTGLAENNTYYVRAYAANNNGTSYGNMVSFNTLGSGSGNDILNPNLTYGSMTDQDGNTYATIVIGTQEWMAENLRTTTYANGDPIPNVTDGTQFEGLTTGAWAHYNNDSQYENPYGKLYNWYTVDDPRNVCPTGWHVPTDAEYLLLTDYLGGDSVAGGKMKSTSGLWNAPNTEATNSSGFSGLPGGYRVNDGSFYFIGEYCGWWSSAEYDTDNAWSHNLFYDSGNVDRGYYVKGYWLWVRCLRD